MRLPLRQTGAALLAAMLTVALVATYAASAMWQQWRAIEVEAAERSRIQSSWILVGALDWSRLILREDSLAKNDRTDNLTEPWSVPLEEARLSTFLAAQRGVSQADDASADTYNAFLSGRITDLQSRLNLRNLVVNNTVNAETLKAFGRLFNYLGLPQDELRRIATHMQQAVGREGEGAANSAAPLLPHTLQQLTWWGISPVTLSKLAPYVTLLPEATKVNLNTASAEVIWAAADGLDMSQAQQIVQSRDGQYFKSVQEAMRLLGDDERLTAAAFEVSSAYFEVRGRMRIDQTVVEERSLILKQRGFARTLWRERGGFLRDTTYTMGNS